ncbi:hypothetical protein [Thermocoleostomius sinensis]|uniref:Uncharacterized protein n=1 Tax=Thermocoleostomius sinensis A174 TaxID=2016057 RepID=A0A9E8ZKS2_9CYAN|nr:hypothetical protein [Thermocoleostomius sinensis]WAL60311.1 hypothetical protein OXH18_24625 [Thermocoleostomius sinensis A174]
MVLKFLGLGKKSEYFLEAEPQPSNGSEPATAEKPKTESVATTTPEAVKDAVSSTLETAASEAKSALEAAAAVATSATEAVASKATKTTKKSKKSQKAKVESVTVEIDETTQAEAKAEIKAIPASSNTFATDHLIPKNTPRRRPGPSLDMFKDMARQMNSK